MPALVRFRPAVGWDTPTGKERPSGVPGCAIPLGAAECAGPGLKPGSIAREDRGLKPPSTPAGVVGVADNAAGSGDPAAIAAERFALAVKAAAMAAGSTEMVRSS